MTEKRIEDQVEIHTVEQFYSFYETADDPTKYVKAKVPYLLMPNPDKVEELQSGQINFAASHDMDERGLHNLKYLGSARLDDWLYLRRILDGRSEVI